MPPTKPHTPLTAAVHSGDHRLALEALRDGLAESFAEAGTRERAPIARQLQAVLAELSALPAEKADDPIRMLEKRRQERLAGRDSA